MAMRLDGQKMSNCESKEIVTRRYVQIVTNPCVVKDIQDAIAFAGRRFESIVGRPVTYDDDLMVSADEEHICIYFERTESP